MRALFMRGAFTAADAVAAGQTLAAYALGLIPFVLIRSVVATFFARGDTKNPVKAALAAAAVNIGFKFLLVGSLALAQVGLALATSIGAWINLLIVVWLAARAGLIGFDPGLRRAVIKIAAAGIALAVALWLGNLAAARYLHDGIALGDEMKLALLVAIGAVVYGGLVLALFGRQWLAAFRRPAPPPL